jgi:hypothetical protein
VILNGEYPQKNKINRKRKTAQKPSQFTISIIPLAYSSLSPLGLVSSNL